MIVCWLVTLRLKNSGHPSRLFRSLDAGIEVFAQARSVIATGRLSTFYQDSFGRFRRWAFDVGEIWLETARGEAVFGFPSEKSAWGTSLSLAPRRTEAHPISRGDQPQMQVKRWVEDA